MGYSFAQIEDALKQYQGQVGKPFQFLHCWYVLRQHKKWQDWVSGKVEDPRPVKESRTSCSADQDTSGDPDSVRPMGRDAAKKRRNEAGGSSSSSACLEVLQRMAMNRELKNQSEAAWAEEHREMQREKLALQREQTALHREQINLTKFEHEQRIMLMDLDKYSGWVREYFLRLQEDIINK